MPHRIGSAGHHGKGGLVMNCCNAYGQCTQGHDCPCRSTPATKATNTADTTAKPTNTDSPYDEDIRELMRRCEIWACLAGAVGFVGLCFVAGYVWGKIQPWLA